MTQARSSADIGGMATGPHPRVTVGIPVYNGENFLAEAIESVLAQTYADLELLIADNCSTDSTREICDEYARLDARVHYRRNERNLGGPANFNLLAGLARGEYFKWVAHDDRILPELLEAGVRALDSAPDAVLAYSCARCIDEGGAVLHSYEGAMEHDVWPRSPADRFRRLIFEVAANHSISIPVYVFGLVRTAQLRKTRLLRPYISADNNLVAELLLSGRFLEIPEYLNLIRYHPGSSGWIPAWSASRLQEYFLPEGADLRQRLTSLGWRQYVEYYRLAATSPLSLTDRASIAATNTVGLGKRLAARLRLFGRRRARPGVVVVPWQRY
jgi:glycosyltransferase involved in cell wall biosynthesis